MAYKLKSTGIAANCTMCIAVDPDTGTVKDFASALVTADMTVDAGVTIASALWDGSTRSYFRCASNNIIKFGTNKPTLVQNGTTNPALSFVAGLKIANPQAVLFGIDSSNYFAHVNTSTGGSTSPTWFRAAGQLSGTGTVTVGEQAVYGFASTKGGNLKGYRALHDAASMTVSPQTTLASGASDISWALSRLCGRNDQAATTYNAGDVFFMAAFDTELAESDFDALRDDWFNTLLEVDAGGDTTAPTLSSPTGTATGSTAASGSVSTDEAGGTLYAVVTTSSTAPSAAQVQAGQDHTSAAAPYATSQAVSATGAQAVNATGLTGSTTYYWHYCHEDAAGNDSAVVSSASFTTDAAGGGNTPPTFPGPNIGAQSGTEGVALTPLDVSGRFSDSDALTFSAIGSWPPGVTVNSAGVISGTPTTAGTYSGLQVRATDTAAQSVDSDTFAFTIAAAPPAGAVITTAPLKNNTGGVLASTAIAKVAALALSDMTLAASWSNVTTEATGELILADEALVDATDYLVVTSNADGTAVGVRAYTASE